jgi:hypothetical protein
MSAKLQPSWANTMGLAARSGWTTVTSSNERLAQQPHHRRRVLFVRSVHSHDCDPGHNMLAVNRALVHARAHVTVRLIEMRYTKEGGLTRVLGGYRCEDELPNFARRA